MEHKDTTKTEQRPEASYETPRIRAMGRLQT